MVRPGMTSRRWAPASWERWREWLRRRPRTRWRCWNANPAQHQTSHNSGVIGGDHYQPGSLKARRASRAPGWMYEYREHTHPGTSGAAS